MHHRLGMLAALLLASATLGCPSNRNFVRFDGSASQLFNTFVDPGTTLGDPRSFIEGGSALGNEYLKCADGMSVTYQRDPFFSSTSSELHLFTVDPASITSVSFSPVVLQQMLAQRSASVLPNTVVIPYSATGPNATVPVTVPLSGSMFWGPQGPDTTLVPMKSFAGCYPVSSPQSWRFTGGVGTFAVFQHGFCARTFPLAPILTQVTSGIWQNFSTSVENPQQRENVALSFVVQPGFLDPQSQQFNANDPTDVRGGFRLLLDFAGDYASTTNAVSADYHFFFGLRGGVVSLDTFVRRSLNGNGVWGWAFRNNLQDGLEKTLPQSAFNIAQAQQMIAPPNSPACSDVSDCKAIAGVVAGGVTSSAAAAAGLQNATPTDLANLRCSMGDDVSCAQIGASSHFADRWACPPNPPRTCQFVVPVKRLNVFEDQIETVFFDGPETNNGAFGLVVAGGPSAQQRMCTANPPPTQPSSFTRSVTLVGIVQ